MQTLAQTTFRRLPVFGKVRPRRKRRIERERQRERGGRVGVSLRGTTNGTRGIVSHFLKAMVQFYDLFVVAFTHFCVLSMSVH